MKIFVGGLSWSTDSHSLRSAFEPFGAVTDAVVITERDTGRSRGFGFVTFEREEDARAAMEKMNGAMLDGRSIRCDNATDRKPMGGGGGGGGRGGFGGGGGGGGRGGFGGGGGGGRGGDRGGERGGGRRDRW